MIHSDQELKCTQERITYFEGLVAQFRVSVQSENFAAMAGGYLAEIEKMHAEVIAYLSHHLREAQTEEVMPYISQSLGAESMVENASAPARSGISGELQHGRENNEVTAMSDWKARKRAKALAAKMSPTKPEPKTAAAMLA